MIIQSTIKLYCDGGTRGSVVCVHDPQRDRSYVKKRTSIQPFTNNDLEYLGVIYALEYARHYYPRRKILLISDSQLIVNHINGKFKCNIPNLQRLLSIVQKKMKKGDKIRWVPRTKNLAGCHLEQFY